MLRRGGGGRRSGMGMDDEAAGREHRWRRRRRGSGRGGLRLQQSSASRAVLMTTTTPSSPPPRSQQQRRRCLIQRQQYCSCLGGKSTWRVWWIHKDHIRRLCPRLSPRPPVFVLFRWWWFQTRRGGPGGIEIVPGGVWERQGIKVWRGGRRQIVIAISDLDFVHAMMMEKISRWRHGLQWIDRERGERTTGKQCEYTRDR